MAKHSLAARSRRFLSRFGGVAALAIMYLVATVAISGMALTSGTAPAEAKGGKGGGGGGGGKGGGKGGGGGGRGGRGGRRGRGRGGVYWDYGVGSCTIISEQCGAAYGWRTRAFYRCLRLRGC